MLKIPNELLRSNENSVTLTTNDVANNKSKIFDNILNLIQCIAMDCVKSND